MSAYRNTFKKGKPVKAEDAERYARKRCMQSLRRVGESIGFDRPLGEYSSAEAGRLVVEICTAYRNAMTEFHEMTVTPPVRGNPLADEPPVDFDDPIPF